MKLRKVGTNELSKYRFGSIALMVTLEAPKGLKRVQFGCFYTFCQFLKNGIITLFCFYIQLLGDDIDQLSRDGFD